MRLTRFTNYSLRALVYLGQHTDQRVTINEVSEVYGISKNHLMKVISNLTRLGVVAAQRGPGGGICLNKLAENISLGEIVSNTEKHLQDLESAGLREHDGSSTDSRMQSCLQQALRAYLDVLGQYTLADILQSPESIPDVFDLNVKAA